MDITPVTGCICGPPAYTFDVYAKEDQTDTTKCCYTFSVSVASDPLNKICRLSKFVIIAKDPLYNINEIVYEHPYPVEKGTTITGEFCLEKATSNNGKTWSYRPINIEIDYYMSSDIISCRDNRLVTCMCKCGNGTHNNNNFNRILEVKKSFGCCYEIWINNQWQSHIDGDDFNYLYINFPTNNNYYLFSGEWEAEYGYGKWLGFRRPYNGYIFPYEKIYVGKICIPRGEEFKFDLNSTYNFSTTGSNLCDVTEYKLTCSRHIMNCADSISAFLKRPVWNTHLEQGCIYMLRYRQTFDESTDCDIYSIKLFKHGDTIPCMIYTPQDTAYPFFSQNDSLTLGLVGANDIGPGLSYDVGFYRQNGSLITMKHVEDSCNYSFTPPAISSTDDYTSTDPLSGIKHFRLYPNPAESDFILNLGLDVRRYVKIDIINQLGEKVLNVYEGMHDKNIISEYKVNMDYCGSGSYFVRISGDGFVKNYPFIILK